MVRTSIIKCLSLLTLAACADLQAADYFVPQRDPNAADENARTEAEPFKALTKACDAAKARDTVTIKQGIYR